MSNYKSLSPELTRRMKEEKENGTYKRLGFRDEDALRRVADERDEASVWRKAFARDADKILYCPFYSRYADKTQVFSLRKNDDITHRGLHVQLVSRIARTIGGALNLNVDLIEAIALGHDLGHTPFGHAGEEFLDELYRENTGRRFSHNVHSVRVIDEIFPLNITLQTLDGVFAHNGELEVEKCAPKSGLTFERLDNEIEACYTGEKKGEDIFPSTLEGCVVRISDVIAYLGKDRGDAERSDLNVPIFADYGIGTTNAEIINNLSVNIIENSYGKPYVSLDGEAFKALSACKRDNYEAIYKNPDVKYYDGTLKEMMRMLYERLLFDLKNGVTSSPVFSHHVRYLNKLSYKRNVPYEETELNQIVVDYIASMTDDYFVELFAHLFPNSRLKVKYAGYFE